MSRNPNRGRTYRRCACRDITGRQLGARCPELVHRRHGRWAFAVDLPTLDAGRKTLRRCGFPTKAQADAALDRVLACERMGVRVDDRQTVAEYLTTWLEIKQQSLKPTTLARYRDYIDKDLSPALGAVRLEELNHHHIAGFVSNQIAAGRGPVTVHRCIATLSSALTDAVRHYRLIHNPARYANIPRPRRGPRTCWTPAQAVTFLDHCAHIHDPCCTTPWLRMWSLVGVVDADDVVMGDPVGLPFFVRDESVRTSWTRSGPPESLAGGGGPLLGAWRHPVLMVGTDPLEVDRLLAGGELRCPGCAGELRPWGHARWRMLRGLHEQRRRRPRRSCCSGCRATHVLLPASCLLRRADDVVVIGSALLAKATGVGHRPVAVLLGLPVSTVRGWLRRFGFRAEGVRVLFTGLLHALEPAAGAVAPTGSVFGDALEVLGLAAAAAARLFGPRPVWQFAASASGGLLLGPSPAANTS